MTAVYIDEKNYHVESKVAMVLTWSRLSSLRF